MGSTGALEATLYNYAKRTPGLQLGRQLSKPYRAMHEINLNNTCLSSQMYLIADTDSLRAIHPLRLSKTTR